MIINYFYFVRVVIPPFKTDSPLIVDSNTVLTPSLTLQGFKPISRRHSQIIDGLSAIEHTQLSQCISLNVVRKLFGEQSIEDSFRFLTSE